MSRSSTFVALLFAFACFAGGCDVGASSKTPPPTAAKKTEPEAAPKPPPKPEGLRFEILCEDVPSVPVRLLGHPDGGSFFILGRDGDLYHYDRPLESFPVGKEGRTDAVRRFAGRVTKMKIEGSFAKGDMGTIGMALDPDFLKNGFFYVWYADKKDENVALDRFAFKGGPKEVVASRTNVVRFSRNAPPTPYHMGGIVEFMKDGSLLIMSGDAERPELSQNKKDLNGKLLRIRPKPEGGYEVPADNPHVGDPEWAPEIVAIGLRAPFRGSFDKKGRFYFGDVGSVYEEINLWDGKPCDFGWGRGAKDGKLTDGPTSPGDTVKPLVYWSQKEDLGAAEDPDYNGETRLSAAFGLVYEGFLDDRYAGFLTDKAIFFDVMRGWVRAATRRPDGTFADHRHVGHRQFIADMTLGRDGYVYGVAWARPKALFRARLSHEITEPPPWKPDKGKGADSADDVGSRRDDAAPKPAGDAR
jgi:glucose/arabinose dehydrogenase